ncbi:fumarylacetoacetate hydrolase family protein [Marinactinospora thermotolerans]|uniref:2-keto-4-pentenoate hydratase/2-oxohepta-3-ene-1,7-dioic acid hydratase (Catechol pathway) n=1 Tax=Marinactinospora thermotolerans DSM 45154 TaxID=1122192 RepID=A0A1T4LYT5_9ACTN|nr:fumarylacetoacetate hydrolase family protein [Marinactinospora thermotolerans]SJZ59825.1 2-keto-4-pentenoate hydratase/2-oxohepta-3-ene-1,7-dioic acid hydratase (catechol pathway) [Marinactinospora thermotolerans DSM 45154]
MYLMRIGPAGAEVPAVRVGTDRYIDVSDVVGDVDAAFLASDPAASLAPLIAERVAAGAARPLEGIRIGPPIARPHQILCVGLNYTDHAAATGQTLPDEPVITTKAPNTLSGPTDPLVLPPGSDRTDWEVELGVVVGRRVYRLSDEGEAEEAIAGYTLVNDVSERALQFDRGGQWMKGKSAPTFTPCGPFLATRDEIPDVGGLDLWLDVNGAARQRGSTKDMAFGPARLVHYLSHFMVLEPGDLICTGTPAGTGMTSSPPGYLASGDVVELGCGPLGTQRYEVTESGQPPAAGPR